MNGRARSGVNVKVKRETYIFSLFFFSREMEGGAKKKKQAKEGGPPFRTEFSQGSPHATKERSKGARE